ncbi:YjbQ family protein [Verticiella sediminum]|uniref:YjbQ family protein n=1 Tax=Verticiella sediminum TaxID=1247510 RepID=A0A556AYC6_9BURK|nr:secondary thiamine-phosphate synthase enzyme YjbQ [Verticiella sediminum]TSH97922.1 YjbQ family protein [Verticiella sediminum]
MSLPARIVQHRFSVLTPGRGFTEISREVARCVAEAGMQAGTAHVYTHHTSCSLIITENAAPEVRHDLERYIARLVPDGDPAYRHDDEGPDDMPAHIRAVLTSASATVPIVAGALALGTWQGIYLWEHRTHGHRRQLTITLTGA